MFFHLFQKLGMLIRDASNPEKFSGVLIDKAKERQVILTAKGAKKPAVAMMNGIMSCVFTMKELAASTGLGLRTKKGPNDNGTPLDGTKVAAIRGK